jgi:hypothetical protein
MASKAIIDVLKKKKKEKKKTGGTRTRVTHTIHKQATN